VPDVTSKRLGRPDSSGDTGGASAADGSRAVVRAVVVCDLVASTRLVERLGDRRAHDIIHHHDRLARDLIHRHDGTEIDKSDGFLLLFDRPISAVTFAVAYHAALAELSTQEEVDIAARVGVHLGEVYLWENDADDVARGAKPVEVEGLAKPVAARLAALALPRQTIISGAAHELARRASHGVPAGLRWMSHGAYELKGVSEPIDVFEVGVDGRGPFSPPPRTEAAAEDASGSMPHWLWWVGSIVLSLVAVWFWWGSRDEPGLAFEAKDEVVLADVVNRTGEALLDESLGAALRVGLEQSPYARLLPRSRVRDALERMQVESDTPIDREIGIEICLREGARALLVVGIAEVGADYVLTAEVIDPQTGATVAVESDQAASRDEIVESLGRLTTAVRRRLGESLESVERSSVQLEKVTTPSLEALKAYSVGLQMGASGEYEQAMRLIERAVEVDSEFATAHALLGTWAWNILHDDRLAGDHWRQALELEGRLTEKERLYVEGSMTWLGTPGEALQAWSLMASLVPEEPRGHANLGFVQWWYMNDFSAAAEAFSRGARYQHPWRFSFYLNLAYCHLGTGDLDRALQDFQGAWELERNPLAGGLSDGYVAVGRYDDARRFLKETSDFETLAFPFYQFERKMRVVTLELDQGRLGAALDVVDSAIDFARELDHRPSRLRAEMARIAILERRDPASMEKQLRATVADLIVDLETDSPRLMAVPVARLALLGKVAARNGLVELAEELLRLLSPFSDGHDVELWRAHVDLLRGEIASAHGHYEEAITVFRKGLRAMELLQLHESLSRAFEGSGEHELAGEEARWLIDNRGRAFAEWIDWFYGRELHLLDWAEAHIDFAAAERSLGRTASARSSLELITEQWANGDSDSTLVHAARRALAETETPAH